MIEQKNVWTIGHSTHTIEHFVSLLNSLNIEIVADIRNYPGSKRYPHFNKDALKRYLKEGNINYVHLKDLGGRRKVVADSVNKAWRNNAFRGYADYMQTTEFKNAVETLQQSAIGQKTAFMCSEAVWWSCHRSLVSDYLKINGWQVLHIMGEGKATEHPYTKPARIIDGQLRYDDPTLF